MEKREVYINVMKNYIRLQKELNGDYCCYNYNNEEQEKNNCSDKDCDKCINAYYEKMENRMTNEYDDAK